MASRTPLTDLSQSMNWSSTKPGIKPKTTKPKTAKVQAPKPPAPVFQEWNKTTYKAFTAEINYHLDYRESDSNIYPYNDNTLDDIRMKMANRFPRKAELFATNEQITEQLKFMQKLTNQYRRGGHNGRYDLDKKYGFFRSYQQYFFNAACAGRGQPKPTPIWSIHGGTSYINWNVAKPAPVQKPAAAPAPVPGKVFEPVVVVQQQPKPKEVVQQHQPKPEHIDSADEEQRAVELVEKFRASGLITEERRALLLSIIHNPMDALLVAMLVNEKTNEAQKLAYVKDDSALIIHKMLCDF